MEYFNKSLQTLIDSIEQIRSMSIGIVYFMNGSSGFLMKDSTETFFHIVTITNMGGVVEEYTASNPYILKIQLVPKEYGSLQNLLNNPIEYAQWILN